MMSPVRSLNSILHHCPPAYRPVRVICFVHPRQRPLHTSRTAAYIGMNSIKNTAERLAGTAANGFHQADVPDLKGKVSSGGKHCSSNRTDMRHQDGVGNRWNRRHRFRGRQSPRTCQRQSPAPLSQGRKRRSRGVKNQRSLFQCRHYLCAMRSWKFNQGSLGSGFYK
jgi:hypothetical protein